MFPFCELSDIGPLRCYEDDLLGNYHVAEADDCTHQYLSNEKYISNSDSYRIYPNPVKETLTIINSSLPKLETINVEIYSITGLKLLSKCLIEATEIDVSNYSAGIYFILIKQNDKIFHKEKIIVE
jgi:hypothetical protein